MHALVALIFLTAAQHVCAQDDTPKFEIGAQYTALRFGELDITDSGFGGRFTYNINRNIAVEAEGNFFPKDREFEGGRKVQGLFGVKAGVRGERVGVFAKARPGFVRFGRFYTDFVAGQCQISLTPEGCPPRTPGGPPRPIGSIEIDPIAPTSEIDFVFDVGGVIELYPSRRTLLRFDVGDTIIRGGSERVFSPIDLPPQPLTDTANLNVGIVRATSHNLQLNVGVGFRL